MVRFRALRPDGRDRICEAIFPLVRSVNRHAPVVRGLRRRLCGTTDRRCDLRPLRRPYRPQSGADRDAPLDRSVDVSCRLVPTYEQIGIWGAVVLVVLRFIQGIGLGGEWGG